MQESDAENPYQQRAWRHAQVPLVYVEGELADAEDHPNAKSAAAMIRFCQRPEIPVDIGLSIDGGVLDRRDKNGQPAEEGKGGTELVQSVGLAASVTAKPCNPKCALWMFNDLTKSDLSMPAPDRYWKTLKKTGATKSIHGAGDHGTELYLKALRLKKSLADYMSAFTHIKCKKCGSAHRFFKSTTDLPNACHKCGSHHSMSDIWGALNR